MGLPVGLGRSHCSWPWRYKVPSTGKHHNNSKGLVRLSLRTSAPFEMASEVYALESQNWLATMNRKESTRCGPHKRRYKQRDLMKLKVHNGLNDRGSLITEA